MHYFDFCHVHVGPILDDGTICVHNAYSKFASAVLGLAWGFNVLVIEDHKVI